MVRRACRIAPPADIDFAPGAGGARFLAHGWSLPERRGVWNDGPEAALLFDLGCRPSGDVLVQLEMAPFLAPGEDQRVVEAYSGEEFLESWALVPGGNRAICESRASGLSDDPRDLAMRLIRGRVSPDVSPES